MAVEREPDARVREHHKSEEEASVRLREGRLLDGRMREGEA